MRYSRRIMTILGLAATAALAGQDTAPPAPPTPAAPPVRAAAPPAPTAPSAWVVTPAAPAAPAPPALDDRRNWLDSDAVREAARDMAQQARDQAQEMRDQGRVIAEQAREQARQAVQDMHFNMDLQVAPFGNLNLDLAPQRGGVGAGVGVGVGGGVSTMPARIFRTSNDNTLYGRGQSALDEHKYDQALDAFTEVVARGGPKADGALYWKAYTLNKLGRRDEAVATIAQLRTSFPSSHWLEDAKALELEVKQATGKPVSPESESDDDLKLMALNGIAQTDPARAFPLLEKLLKGPASPKLKKNAIYVLAVNTSPQAQQLLEQIARGNSNPDLQLTAISYMLRNKQFPNRTQVLFEIYGSTSDLSVKREIISSLRSNNDTDHLLQIYRSEKDSSLRRDAISGAGDKPGNPELWQLYQGETTTEGKLLLLDVMYNNGNTEKLAEVARKDSDPKVRMRAIQVLSSQKAVNTADTLASIYASEQDAQVKRQILNELSSRRNAKALVDIYHKESNFEMKKQILSHLGNMHTAEANELYMEILSK